MDRRYQVFVSSTYEDLQEERREVMQALLALDCIPTGMELFPAADDDSWTLIKRFIGGCDYYVVIVGGRYGSMAPTGKSFTEMEYDFAVEARLPILAFLHGDPGQILASRTEPTQEGRVALASFRTKIEAARHAKYWSSSKELPGLVISSMASLMKIKPRVGWVRGDSVPDESAAQEILGLKRKIEGLEAQIEKAGMTVPAGSENLAHGDETISVRFRYEDQGIYQDQVEGFSWNGIISVLGPVLIGTASEGDLKETIVEVFRNRFHGRFGRMILKAYVRDEDFQRIKLQLRALGIIREVEDRPYTGKGHTQWMLTAYGDRLMTQVAAIRSGVPS